MQRHFLQCLIISLVFLSFISTINTRYIYARGLSEDAVSYRDKGYEAQEKGEIDSAITWYQKAVSLDPTYAVPHNDLGILFEAKGWLERAESEYQEALSIDPDYGKAHTNLALLYERKGELEKAAFHWMRRYKLGKPDDPWTEEAKKRLEKLGLLEKTKEKKPEAERHEREVPVELRTEAPKEKARPKPELKEAKKPEKGLRGWTRIGSESAKEKEDIKPKKQKRIKGPMTESPRAAEKERAKTKKSDLDKKLQESLRLAEERLRREKGNGPDTNKKPPMRTDKKAESSARTYYQEANSYYQKGEYSRALDTIRVAKKSYPEESSLLELEQSIKNSMKEERIEDHYNEGIIRYRHDDFSGARKEFEAILNILPE